MQIARLRGWRSCNVVRRADLDDELRALGGDVIARDSDSPETLLAAMGGARPRLALNAVGGASALTLANTLADGGVHVTYGAMGRQPLKIPNGLLIFRGLDFRGFWLRRVIADRARFDRAVGQLAAWMRDGALTLAVHETFPLARLHDALAAAETGGRSGKILLDLRG
jgi:trans-2-enoyl-CoA reductase